MSDTHPFTHRIRRCNGNRVAWCLIHLRPDGTEMNSFGAYTTAMSIEPLLSSSLLSANSVIHLVRDRAEIARRERAETRVKP